VETARNALGLDGHVWRRPGWWHDDPAAAVADHPSRHLLFSRRLENKKKLSIRRGGGGEWDTIGLAGESPMNFDQLQTLTDYHYWARDDLNPDDGVPLHRVVLNDGGAAIRTVADNDPAFPAVGVLVGNCQVALQDVAARSADGDRKPRCITRGDVPGIRLGLGDGDLGEGGGGEKQGEEEGSDKEVS